MLNWIWGRDRECVKDRDVLQLLGVVSSVNAWLPWFWFRRRRDNRQKIESNINHVD